MPHAAVLNPEILTRIFWQASPEPSEDEWPRNDVVAKSARVCQAFCEPATRVLWERLPSVFPLLKLLAPSFGRIKGGHKTNNEWGTDRKDAYVGGSTVMNAIVYSHTSYAGPLQHSRR